MALVHSHQLSKSFGGAPAVQGVSLRIEPGECFGLLGPNGAGKSTIINMIYGVVHRTGGELTVFGHDPSTQSRSIKKRLGVVTQDNALDESLTVEENMLLYAAFQGLPAATRAKRVRELLEYMNLAHKADSRIQTLSGGMRRRLVFVRALLGEPELVILDEPTTGLDPAVRHLIWGKVKELRARGTTVILTTHYMHEAEILCDRLSILNQGKLVALGTPAEMIKAHTPGFVGIFSKNDEARLKAVTAGFAKADVVEDSSGFHVRVPELAQLTSIYQSHGLNPLQIRPANLEDVFLKITGQELMSDA
ncbi:MAG TPA: ABC transporter ATP-binding protein [Bdellovibrionales bacterium]|nr:ABC transporter ATP-binding protein [Bdellovibrionales bacterium]